MLLNIHRQNIDCHLIVSPFGYDQVRISFARFDELQVHRLQDTGITFHNSFCSTSALHYIPLYDTNQTFVRISIHKDLKVHHATQFLVAQGKNPFTLDSKPATGDYKEFILGENRYAALKQQFPEEAATLFARAEQEAKDKYDYYKKLNDME